MGIECSPIRKLAMWALVCAAAGAAPAKATTLTFDVPNDPSCFACIPADYGSRVGDTPNIAVSYRVILQGAGNFTVYGAGYGELVNAMGHVQYDVPGEIILTPDPGYGVRLNAFQIAGWFADYQTAIAIYDSNGSIAKPNLFAFSGVVPGNASISPMAGPVASTGPIRIYVSNIGSTGIDNLSFQQFPATGLNGASITGTLKVPYASAGNFDGPNLFDPANGYVPPGYGNSMGPTVNMSSAGAGNFAFLLGGGSIENPVIDSWLAQFTGPTLTVTFRNPNYSGALSGSQLTFKSQAFLGATVALVGQDAFVTTGNGGMTADISGDTLTLTVAPQCLIGSGCSWPQSTFTNTYSVSLSTAGVSLSLSTSLVAGCKSVSGRVTLPSPAPVGGTIVSINDTLTAATPPETLKIPEGATTKSFTIKTVPVTRSQSGTVTASVGGASASRTLTVRPMGLQSMTLTPTTVAGSQPVSGTAKLECAAGPGPVTVDLSSSKPSVASPVSASVVIPQGLQSQPFAVATNPVLGRTYAMISGEANGTNKTRKLNVTPAAELSPKSLKFGNLSVGATSGALTTTLSNKGTSPIVVDSIGITGSYASWFSQTNNCPSNLAAGASCTVSVRFSPQLALTKSAKLVVTTSATSTPLGVTLSGTGI